MISNLYLAKFTLNSVQIFALKIKLLFITSPWTSEMHTKLIIIND